MKKLGLLILLSYVLIIHFSNCSRQIYRVASPALLDDKYDSEFPYKNSSLELKQIAESIRKITAISYYKSYIFSEKNPATAMDIKLNSYRNKVVDEKIYSNSVIGTGIVIYFSENKVVLITCAHIVDYEDTVITYYRDKKTGITPYIKSIAFKQRQNNFVAEFPERGELEILAIDHEADLVVLGKKFLRNTPVYIPQFQYKFGTAKELEWGSFVYLIGFPKGYQMITKAIVSQPNRDKKGGFIVDALFNQGFSGGVVLAIRDGVPNFEFVGIANSVAADLEYNLTPDKEFSEMEYDSRIPYTGDIFINLHRNINYGITFIISIETITEFLKKYDNVFREKGYNFSYLFNETDE
jgi:hypothetical protein